MKPLLTPVILLGLILLPACSRVGGGTQGASSSSSAVAASSEDVRETRNVTYRGTVEPLGVTIYQQGTHALSLGDGRMLILESDNVDLEMYLGHTVEVFGSLRPTVEAGGIIMRVERLIDLTPESSASSSESSVASSLPSSFASSSSSSSSAASLASTASITSSERSSTPSPSSASLASSSARSLASSNNSQASASAGASVSAEIDARIVLMAKQDMSDRNWTQQYCTEHVGFCVPVHRNWWFVSFGNTAQTLWHVEVSSESFEGMGSGPISIDLVGGELSGRGDGDVTTAGGVATGYRSWTQGRHFRITADARLEAAVRYMAEHLRATEAQ